MICTLTRCELCILTSAMAVSGETHSHPRGVRSTGTHFHPSSLAYSSTGWRVLAARAHTLGVQVTGRLLRGILYANDIVLLAESAHYLQALLYVLSEFCTAAMSH
jgi:hypothetical protein